MGTPFLAHHFCQAHKHFMWATMTFYNWGLSITSFSFSFLSFPFLLCLLLFCLRVASTCIYSSLGFISLPTFRKFIPFVNLWNCHQSNCGKEKSISGYPRISISPVAQNTIIKRSGRNQLKRNKFRKRNAKYFYIKGDTIRLYL